MSMMGFGKLKGGNVRSSGRHAPVVMSSFL